MFSGDLYEGDGDVACDQYHKYKVYIYKVPKIMWHAHAQEAPCCISFELIISS